jgi:hypothetical protein
MTLWVFWIRPYVSAESAFFGRCIGRTIYIIKKPRMKRMHTAHEQTKGIYVMYEKLVSIAAIYCRGHVALLWTPLLG